MACPLTGGRAKQWLRVLALLLTSYEYWSVTLKKLRNTGNCSDQKLKQYLRGKKLSGTLKCGMHY